MEKIKLKDKLVSRGYSNWGGSQVGISLTETQNVAVRILGPCGDSLGWNSCGALRLESLVGHWLGDFGKGKRI